MTHALSESIAALAQTILRPEATTGGTLFDTLDLQAPDALLSLIALYRDDPRKAKIDLGVGVYKTPDGRTPVMRAVKAAEQRLWETQETKSYLGPEGDVGFLEALAPIVLGARIEGGVFAVQTPGGTGALRLAAELIATARPGVRVFMGVPTWPNHPQLFAHTRLNVVTYRHFDAVAQVLCFDEMLAAFETGNPGDVVLLHGCCHNPTGADLDTDQWRQVAEVVSRRGLTPLIDLAYQGLGDGVIADAAGLRQVVEAVPDTLIAYSCDKNFALYRERVGALFVTSRSSKRLDRIASNIRALARTNWSMPPDHGAAVVRIILQDPVLTTEWSLELEGMLDRLTGIRKALVSASPALTAIAGQKGLFAQLPLSPSQVERLRRDHGVYMAGSGRINLAGLTAASIPQFAHAYSACAQEIPA